MNCTQCGKISLKSEICPRCIAMNYFRNIGVKNILREFGVPERIAGISILDFNQRRAIEPSTESIFFTGSVGTGKTVAATKEMLNDVTFNLFHSDTFQKNRTYLFISCPELLFQIKSSFVKPIIKYENGTVETEEEKLVRLYQNVDFLILDDIGVEKSSEWTVSTLFLILAYRYDHFKKTLLTSNFSPQELGAQFGDMRLTSRINEWMQIVNFNGKDRRAKNG